ncbi:MAG: cytochrome c biogenesis protein ResB [Alistipes sp.]|nr:cytochrome c biogenesis protein ResB [Alistipes sp.]
MGDFPVDIFTFPLNVIIVALWLFVVVYLYRNRSNIAWVESMLSIRATWLSLAVMVATGIYLGLQREPNSTSWLIVTGMLFTLTHLLFITLRGLRTPQGIRWRFTLLHLGLILTLGAGFWGAPDRTQLRAILTDERPTEIAYHINGTATKLNHAITLRGLNAEYNESGMPTYFDATIEIDNKEATIKVNHPYNRTLSEKIYLVSVDAKASYCIVEIVREPWQWVSLAGIVMLLSGAVMLFIRGPRHQANIDKK